MRKLTEQADEAAQHNIAFSCLWQLGDIDACVDLLRRTNRAAEATLFEKTYRESESTQTGEGEEEGEDEVVHEGSREPEISLIDS